MLDADPVHTVVIGDERQGARFVGDRDATFLRDFGMRFDQARAATPGLNREATPELEFSVDLVGLPPVYRDKADALTLHPAHRVLAACYEQLAQIGIGAILRNAAHIVEELVFGVSAEIRVGDLFVGEVRHQQAEILHTIVHAAEGASGKAAVAARFVFRSAFQHQDRYAVFGCRMGGTKGRVSRTDNDDVTGRRQHAFNPYCCCAEDYRRLAQSQGWILPPVTCMQQTAEFVIERRQFVGFSGISRILEIQKTVEPRHVYNVKSRGLT